MASLFWNLLTRSEMDEAFVLGWIGYYNVILFILLWLVTSLLFGFLHIIISRFISGRIRYYQLIIVTLVTQLLIFFFIVFLLFWFLDNILDLKLPEISLRSFLNLSFLEASIYILIVNFCIAFIVYISSIIGPGNLQKILSGKFYKPLVTEKVFMFIDLKGSTQLAERLGHIAYSNLIQDCFKDLVVVHSYKAEVYQYVGDEAVLTWDLQKAIDDNNAIKAFFVFQKRLEERAVYYEEKYGTVPDFKAGMHGGIITMTEIGAIRRDIAYHGDTINTAARLQGECNRLNVKLLMSEALLTEMDLPSNYKTTLKGEMQLRGKNGMIKVFSIEEKSVQNFN